MTTWAEADGASATYRTPSEIVNDYVLPAYVANGYIRAENEYAWSVRPTVSTAWT
jgi:hypothetical protein